MKLKYYLRGMGIGIILTAIVMGFALGGRKATISDAEVIERAKNLGMIDPSSGVLSGPSNGADQNEENTSASGETLDQTREEVSEEINEELASNSVSDSGLDEAAVEGTKKAEGTEAEEANEASENSSKEESLKVEEDTAVADEIKTDDADTGKSKANDSKTDTAKNDSKTSSDNATDSTKIASAADNASASKTTDSATDNASSNQTAVASESVNTQTTQSTQTTQTTQNKTSGLGSKTTVTKTITIPGGLGSDQVASILQREGIVDSAYSFNQYLCDNRMDRIIRSGTKTIPAGSTYQDIANIICK